MADKKISQLSAATTPLAGTEVLPIVQSGATVKVSVADLTAGRTVDATTVNATTVDATNVEVTNVKAKDGTAAISIADSTGAVTVSSPVSVTNDLQGTRVFSSWLAQSIAANTWTTYFTLADLQGSAYLVTAAKGRQADAGSYMATMIVTKDGAQTAAATALASVGAAVELRLDGANIQAQRVTPYDGGGVRSVYVSILRLV